MTSPDADPTPTVAPRAPRRVILRAAVASLVVGAVSVSCGKSRRKHRATWTRRPAAGRPAGCPDTAVDVYGDGTPGPMDAKCSYADALGGEVVFVTGSVLGEGEAGGLPTGLEAMLVELVPIEATPQGPGIATGPVAATAKTDAQGTFSVSAVLRPGAYEVRVRAPPGPTVLARGALDVAGPGPTERLHILVPADPALRSP